MFKNRANWPYIWRKNRLYFMVLGLYLLLMFWGRVASAQSSTPTPFSYTPMPTATGGAAYTPPAYGYPTMSAGELTAWYESRQSDGCPGGSLDTDELAPDYIGECLPCFERDAPTPVYNLMGTPVSTVTFGTVTFGTVGPTSTPAPTSTALPTSTPAPTFTPNPTCPWEIMFDFTVGSGGWLNYPASGRDTASWVAGHGWHGQALGSPNDSIAIRLPFNVSTTMTYVEIGFETPMSGANPSVRVGIDQNFNKMTVAVTGSDPLGGFFSPSFTASQLTLYVNRADGGGTYQPFNTNYIKYVYIAGQGYNPMSGINSCMLTATPVPTATPGPTSTPLYGGGLQQIGPMCYLPRYRDDTPVMTFNPSLTIAFNSCYTVIPGIVIPLSAANGLVEPDLADAVVDQVDLCVTWVALPYMEVLGLQIGIEFIIVPVIAWIMKRLMSF